MKKYKTNTIVVPKYPGKENRDKNIFLLFSRDNKCVEDIALSYGLSTRTVYRIIEKQSDKEIVEQNLAQSLTIFCLESERLLRNTLPYIKDNKELYEEITNFIKHIGELWKNY